LAPAPELSLPGSRCPYLAPWAFVDIPYGFVTYKDTKAGHALPVMGVAACRQPIVETPLSSA